MAMPLAPSMELLRERLKLSGFGSRMEREWRVRTVLSSAFCPTDGRIAYTLSRDKTTLF